MDKPVSDGLTTDAYDNIYITGVEHGAIYLAKPFKSFERQSNDVADFAQTEFQMVKIVESPKYLRWPDGFSFGPDGLYVTASGLHINFARLGSIDKFAPFHILRLGRDELEKVMGGSRLPAAGQ
jgi:sugar lactone lactonase YvrE